MLRAMAEPRFITCPLKMIYVGFMYLDFNYSHDYQQKNKASAVLNVNKLTGANRRT